MKNILLNEEKIRHRLNQYFNKVDSCFPPNNNEDNYSTSGIRNLKALDRDNHYYTGVTFPYIYKYVMRERCRQEDLVAVIIDMMSKGELEYIFCGNIHKNVFESGYTRRERGYDSKVNKSGFNPRFFPPENWLGAPEAIEELKILNMFYNDYKSEKASRS